MNKYLKKTRLSLKINMMQKILKECLKSMCGYILFVLSRRVNNNTTESEQCR